MIMNNPIVFALLVLGGLIAGSLMERGRDLPTPVRVLGWSAAIALVVGGVQLFDARHLATVVVPVDGGTDHYAGGLLIGLAVALVALIATRYVIVGWAHLRALRTTRSRVPVAASA